MSAELKASEEKSKLFEKCMLKLRSERAKVEERSAALEKGMLRSQDLSKMALKSDLEKSTKRELMLGLGRVR